MKNVQRFTTPAQEQINGRHPGETMLQLVLVLQRESLMHSTMEASKWQEHYPLILCKF